MGKTFDNKLLGQIGLLTGIGVLMPVGIAGAATITQSFGFTVSSNPAEVNNPSGPTSASDPKSTTVTFDPFDPALGTLTEVDVDLNSTLSGSVSVNASTTNENEPLSGGTNSWSASFSLTMPGISKPFSESDSVSCTGSFNCTPSGSKILSFPEIYSTFFTGGSIPSGYTGPTTFDATLALDLTLSLVNQGDSLSSATGGGGAKWDPPFDGLVLTYIYTPNPTVPEPGTLALLGMGAMGGLGFARRRSKDHH
jgi:hypothetical protein